MSESPRNDAELPEVPVLPALRDALTEAFDEPAPIPADRDGAILQAALRRSRRRRHLKRLVIRITPLAAAACLVLAVTFALTWQARPAFAQAATAVARQFIDPVPIDVALGMLDPHVLRTLEAGIDEATARRDETLARLAAAQAAENVKEEARAADDLWQAREDRYRRLRGLGRVPEALDEVNRAVDFARSKLPQEPRWLGLLCVALCDQGDILAAASNYAAARVAYEDSIQARLEHVRSQYGDQSTPAGIQGSVQDMTPLYWRMSYIALAEGDLQGAHLWLAKAEDVLRTYLIGVCRDRAADVPDDASLMAAFMNMPPEFQNPPEQPTLEYEERWAREYGAYRPNATLIVKVHEHLYRVAQLRRVQGDFDGAAEVLEQLQALQAPEEYRDHDESRLPFAVPMEQSRVAIARQEYDQALARINEASKHLDDLDAYGRPLGVVPRAELQMLRGTALLGLDRADQEGQREIEHALELPHRAGARLNEKQRTAFYPWDELAKAAR
jgi:tetratricopeptide (TPR) repeat protein